MHELSRADARRIAVRAQRLTADRPTDLRDLVRHLTLLQLDQTAHVAPSADLVAWSRLGPDYDRAELRDALDEQHLIEHQGNARVPEYLVLLRAEMAAWPGSHQLKDWEHARVAWLTTNEACHRDVLERLRADGPLPTSAFPDTCEQKWGSSGWNDDKNVQAMLGLMVQRGEIVVVGREGREKLWDLAERTFPGDPVVPEPQAAIERGRLRLKSLGIARATRGDRPGEPDAVGENGEDAVVEGVRGKWRVDPGYLDLPFDGRTALLSPLDRLVFDRLRAHEIFEFDYQLEMYKPAAKRRWGYFALPILHGDRLVGKLDAASDRAGGVLEIVRVHEDGAWTAELRADVDAEIGALAAWLELEPVRLS